MTPAPAAALTNPHVLAAIRERVTKDADGFQVAARDLARYYRLLRNELAALEFSRAELMLCWHGYMKARYQKLPSFITAVEAEEQRLRGVNGY